MRKNRKATVRNQIPDTGSNQKTANQIRRYIGQLDEFNESCEKEADSHRNSKRKQSIFHSNKFDLPELFYCHFAAVLLN